MNDILLSGGTVVTDGKKEVADILVRDGRIEQIEPFIQAPASAEVIEAGGKWILPGLIDDQVHFREPGLTHKACIATESRAAVAGGVTTFFEMPNVSPTLSMEKLEEKERLPTATPWQITRSFWVPVTRTWKRLNLPTPQGLPG